MNKARKTESKYCQSWQKLGHKRKSDQKAEGVKKKVIKIKKKSE